MAGAFLFVFLFAPPHPSPPLKGCRIIGAIGPQPVPHCSLQDGAACKREIIWLQTLNFIYDRMLRQPEAGCQCVGCLHPGGSARSGAFGMAERGASEARRPV